MFDPSADADHEGARKMSMEGALEAIESASTYQVDSLVHQHVLVKSLAFCIANRSSDFEWQENLLFSISEL
jgi:hypothetical protein